MSRVVHLVGSEITVDDRFVRQRCAWCGVALLDIDLEGPHKGESFATGSWVAVDGDGLSKVAVDGHHYPDGACVTDVVVVETVPGVH